jgi:hypothetical protein
MSQPTNPFSDHSQPNPYSPPQAPGPYAPQFMPPPGAMQYAPCYNCGNTFANKVSFTWWGGVLGPSLFTHVTCCRCGTAYNGKTGKSNNTAIAIYVVVSMILGLALAVALIAGGVLS